MAQADTTDATKLRSAILNIFSYPRGIRHCSHVIQNCMPTDAGKAGKKLAEIVGKIMNDHIFDRAKSYFDKQAPFQLEDILLSGSHSEGMQKMNLKAGSVSDMDFLLTLKNIKVSKKDQQKGNLAVRENTAFVNLYLTDGELIRTWEDFLETSTNTLGRKKLSSVKLKKRFRENYTCSGPIFQFPQFSNQIVEAVDEGPSLVVCSHLPGNKNVDNEYASVLPFPTEAFDFVLAIKCDGWPLCAQEWRFRPRCWPNQDLVQAITESGFHIVCKSSSEGDFRLSYSNAETLLIQNLTGLQHKTYRAFKSFTSHYKNKWSPKIKKIFCSYHLKTIMLWYCEKSEPKDWTEGSVVGHLQSLIDKLIIALKERNLPMYFMPKYNLMEKMEDGRDVAEKITELRNNVHLITYAVISEEPIIHDWKKFIYFTAISEILNCFVKNIKKKKFDAKDFYQGFEVEEGVLDGSSKCAGKEPTMDDIAGEAMKTFFEMPKAFFEMYYERVNSVGIPVILEELD